MKVWVYGTLKYWFGNHRTMERAEGKLLYKEHIQVEALGEWWYPFIKLSNDSKKWLLVEVYEVDPDKIYILDGLEWYREWHEDTNHYNRKIVRTIWLEDIYVYEYNWTIDDNTLEKHKTVDNNNATFYNWQRL